MSTIFLKFDNINEYTVSCEWETCSTQTGKFRSLLPTNKQIKYQGKSTYKIENNKIAEYTLELDIKTIMRSLH